MKIIYPLLFSVVLTSCAPIGDNFHRVSSDFFRSAQLDKSMLERRVSQYNIKSIINLRGKNENEGWYIEEKALCSEKNLECYDIPLTAQRLPTKEEVLRVLHILETAEYPVLVHCRRGADRSGFVSALYLYAIKKEELEDAIKQLSFLKFGHIRSELDCFFELFEKSGNGMTFHEWVGVRYDASEDCD